MILKIRFNTDYIKGIGKKWRIIFEDFSEKQVDEINILCGSYTTEDVVKKTDGSTEIKYHITAKGNIRYIETLELPPWHLY